MKRFLTMLMIAVVMCSFLLVGNTKADAMNPEAAALLAGGIVLFGASILNAATRGAYYPAPGYYDPYPAYYYPARTEVIYSYPRYPRYYRQNCNVYERGWREPQYRRGRWSAWRGY
jgi:hypothetical protein